MQFPGSKLKLEPTAALVMKWALPLYQENPASQFVNRLDLSSGMPLYEKCCSVCSWYGEIILNRKSFINHLIIKILETDQRQYRVIILAAGKSPLAIELLSEHNDRIHRVYELDITGMEDKQRLYYQSFPGYADKITCIKSDISCGDIPSILKYGNNGKNANIPAIIVIEGISYYLQKKALKNIINTFSKQDESNFIIEYLIPDSCIKEERRLIPQRVFGLIHQDCEQEEITPYTWEEMGLYFKECDGKLLNRYTMTDMEKNRTGVNTYFKESSDGWIECITGVVGNL